MDRNQQTEIARVTKDNVLLYITLMDLKETLNLQELQLFEFGERILFLPVILFVLLVFLGLFLFILFSLISGILKVPVTIFHETVEQKEDEQEAFKKKIKTKPIPAREEIWLDFMSGGWIVWVAFAPFIILVVLGMLYLLQILLNPGLPTV